MLTVLLFMLFGVGVGYLFRNKKILIIHKIILVIIWLLLFFLGLEIGANKNVVSNFGRYGLEAFFIAVAGTLGSVIAARILWKKDKK